MNVINIHNFNKGQPTSILIDGEISNNPNKIANGFNNYFSNVAEKLQGKIHSLGNEFSNFLKLQMKTSFYLNQLTVKKFY